MEAFLWFMIGLCIAVSLVFMRRRYAEFPGQTPQDYDDGFPAFSLKEHLNGEMICEGIIFGPMGRMTSSFVADFNITWDGDTGVMAEEFRYNDGSTQLRQWTITMGEDGHFTAAAPDVPGKGRGVQAGSAVQMRYKIKLPEDVGGHVLNTVDWMYLTPDGTIVNRSQFRKFGFKVAELVATIRPKEM
ncbi:DUF3833 family protein [Sulfitobacter sp. SK011]|uniref:DUF3833 family protein n=1 Tax=Sulfitobacter sp. SK011 TaxID=1389004 RepID=UPI000E0BF8E3|nr:DUF3833 family protein [Sulfitobacter sp. SK011]AXI41007.1 DUF3833 domain-containing protein [Sulfitobacter sp. SK011]